jgi:ABC-type uncharacterized transport system permease subunit
MVQLLDYQQRRKRPRSEKIVRTAVAGLIGMAIGAVVLFMIGHRPDAMPVKQPAQQNAILHNGSR